MRPCFGRRRRRPRHRLSRDVSRLRRRARQAGAPRRHGRCQDRSSAAVLRDCAGRARQGPEADQLAAGPLSRSGARLRNDCAEAGGAAAARRARRQPARRAQRRHRRDDGAAAAARAASRQSAYRSLPTGATTPRSGRSRPGRTRSAREWGFGGKFVVGYSGNLGRAHEYATLLDAAERLRSEPDLAFLFIGGGHGTEALKRDVEARGLGTLFAFRPYQPASVLSQSLAPAGRALDLAAARDGRPDRAEQVLRRRRGGTSDHRGRRSRRRTRRPGQPASLRPRRRARRRQQLRLGDSRLAAGRGLAPRTRSQRPHVARPPPETLTRVRTMAGTPSNGWRPRRNRRVKGRALSGPPARFRAARCIEGGRTATKKAAPKGGQVLDRIGRQLRTHRPSP